MIRRIEAGMGSRLAKDVTVKDCAEFIRAVTQSDRARQQFRLVLDWIMVCAVHEGWIDTNPVLATRRFQHERKRERLTKEVYAAIWDKAEPWLRIAMDPSLVTLLRREDVVSLKFADVRDGFLWVVPLNTEGSTLVKLRIRVDEQLASLLAQAPDTVLSPFMVHRLPERARPSDKRAAARQHHTQVMPEQLTRAFQDARKPAGVAGANPPSFHEIRSLGGALLSESGWPIDKVQELMGHSSAAMKEHYLDGHEMPWQEVQTGSLLARSGEAT
ncbi:tyrosine-type recombinase/integrase [Stenotrophomonas rhizophila]|uniref:tyrosine-type recombinase/integrase n=1 Tax=Stenotrophomonas rhizophila TaxID=216778 RepID=UPI003AF7E961